MLELDGGGRRPTVLHTFTTQRDAESMRSSHRFALLESVMAVEFHFVPTDPAGEHKYAAVSDAHRISVATALADGATIVFLAPDAVWGSFRTAARALEQAKRNLSLVHHLDGRGRVEADPAAGRPRPSGRSGR